MITSISALSIWAVAYSKAKTIVYATPVFPLRLLAVPFGPFERKKLELDDYASHRSNCLGRLYSIPMSYPRMVSIYSRTLIDLPKSIPLGY